MEANVPEKLYVHVKKDKVTTTWNEEWIGFHDIEYIRKDVFIEKACDAYCKVCGHYPHKTPTHICRQDCDYFENFKRYLEGGEE